MGIDDFTDDACKFMFGVIESFHRRRACPPSREMARDIAARYLDVDDPLTTDVLGLCTYEIDPRDMVAIKNEVIEWLRKRAYGKIYSDEGLQAFESSDFTKLHSLVESASSIQDIGSDGFWFFDEFEKILIKEHQIQFTTGSQKLDAMLNNGGPTRGEVMVYMAPTGVGKSIALVNTSVSCYRAGWNVLHVTLEMTKERTAERYCGVFTNIPVYGRFEAADKVRLKIRKERASSDGALVIYEYAPDDITIDTIIALVDHLQKTKKFKPDIITIDYMELMLSKNPYLNRDEYIRQKHVATEMRQLAKRANCFIVTATQTNRGSQEDKEKPIDLNRVAESYGKMMPVDYVVSINRRTREYADAEYLGAFDLYIAKNRNGPKAKKIEIDIDFRTMVMTEIEEANNGNQSQATEVKTDQGRI